MIFYKIRCYLENADLKRSLIVDKEYAKVTWNIEHIKALRPKWDDRQCEEFLINNQRSIQEAMITHGWIQIENLLIVEEA